MTTLADISRESGAFAMVAMDQRESLRHMFDLAGRGRPDDEEIIDFKAAVASELGPEASGFLADREFGLDRVRAALPDTTGLIVAADALTQEPGGPVEDTALDEVVMQGPLDGVAAVKLLLIWRRDDRREERVALAERFIAGARERGVLSVLEPVARLAPGEDGDLDEAVREAARELAPLGPSLYKAQVPRAGEGDDREQQEASEALAAVMTGPWVVLSQGVALHRFAGGVRAACRAGASGFLAGRALWSDVVGAADVPAELRARSLPRLQALVELVDATARPWWSA